MKPSYQFNECIEASCRHLFTKYGLPKTVVELGVFEGYFTFNLTNAIASENPNYKHYSIDPFEHVIDLTEERIQQAKEHFLTNLDLFPYKKNVEFINKTSFDGLIELLGRNVKADMIYVDGDHTAPAVLKDLVLGFELLNIGGIMLCDDSSSWCYTNAENSQKHLDYSPRLAVDTFIHCNWGIIEVVDMPNSYQTAFIKRGSHYV